MEDARLGQVLDGRYRLEERLAAGGMGVVYRGQRMGLAKPVAVKFLHRTAAVQSGNRLRFEREAAAMSRLSHPNLVSIIDYGAVEDVPYLVMDFHAGRSLRQVLSRGVLRPERAVFIARQLLAGLASAHASNVVHRDLKPENVLIVGAPGEDLVKILDFGVAKLVEGDAGPSELSVMAGGLLGTAEYMAPEQVRVEHVDARADVYAVGILLYEMVTGRRPFEAERDLAVLQKQVEEAPAPPRTLAPAISAALDAAILRALEKDRDDRWRSADDFGRALARTPEGRSAPALGDAIRRAATVGPEGTAAVPPPPRLRIGVVVLTAVLVITLVGGLWLAAELGWLAIPWRAWLASLGLDPG